MLKARPMLFIQTRFGFWRGTGEKSFGSLQAIIMRHVATNVQEAVVKGSGHWLMEERPAETVALIRSFIEAGSQKSAQ